MLILAVLVQLYLAALAAAQSRPYTYGPQYSHDYCLHAIPASRRVELRQCNINDPSYYWSPYEGDADGRQWLRAFRTDLCLTVPAAPHNGLELTLTPCPVATTLKDMCQACSGGNKNWKRVNTRKWQYDGTNFCLDNSAGQLTNGNKIQVWDCQANNQNQEWMPTDWGVQW